MLRGIGLSKKYKEKILFEDLSIDLRLGRSVGVIGKSTLTNTLIGRINPDSGKVEMSFPKRLMYSKVGIQFQDSKLDNLLKVKEIVEEFRLLDK
ncbi:ATP-binding cassette domain-containing protein [Fructilactobacillus florum]|uniref:ATP-binding cassette domain-containing protein n=1 Tax=Fructilactobacillus florum TaxID=640331 RepID=UPI0007050671|nr:ATP-binding cassette domain-containing protein [Fructilactobacillus florum]